MILLETKCGKVSGLEKEECLAFLGIPFATSERFEYSKLITSWENTLDATSPGPCCPQFRTYNEHLDNPNRRFYKRELRDNEQFFYNENCLNLNIYTPKVPGKYPVIIYLHGGGFDSGSNCENAYDGTNLAKRGIVSVFINYRVSILGYFSHKELLDKNGRDGNFGFDDQLNGIKWVKENIEAFYGDSENITVMGQSAGAISVQYLCLNHQNQGLFQRAIMMSGAGRFPSFGAPKKAECSHKYWEEFMKTVGADSVEDLKKISIDKLIPALDNFRLTHKGNTVNSMPVIDDLLIYGPLKQTFKNPMKIDYMIGYTNNDMFAPALAFIAHKFSKKNKAYLYYFDVDAKGDNSKAFHSSDIRFVFNTLEKSWRPYTNDDYFISELMMSYITNFVYTGNPNTSVEVDESFDKPDFVLPEWKPAGHKAIHLREGKKIKMTKPHYFTLLKNMLTSKTHI